MQIKDYGWKEPKTEAHSYLIPTVKRALSDFKVQESALILDAGCGGGNVMNEIYMSGYKNIYGFDASESGIRLVRGSFPGIRERVEVHNAYDENLPPAFAQGGYSLVFSIEVVEHLYDPRKYLENIVRWLKKGGLLVMSTPYHGYLKNLAIALAGGFDRHVSPLWDGGHIKFWSKCTLYKLMEESGIEPLRFYGSGRLPFLWKSMVVVGRNG